MLSVICLIWDQEIFISLGYIKRKKTKLRGNVVEKRVEEREVSETRDATVRRIFCWNATFASALIAN